MAEPRKEYVKADSVIKIGTRLEFTLFGRDSLHKAGIEDMTDEDIFIRLPTDERGLPIIPAKGEKLYVTIVGTGCGYRFMTVFRGLKDKPFPMLQLHKPDMVEKYQQRAFARLKITRPITVKLLDDEGSVVQTITTNTVDISGGGICFVLFNPMRIGNRVAVELNNMDGVELNQLLGEVVRCQDVDMAGIKIYNVGVKFIEISKVDQNKLIKFIFSVERRNLKNKVGM